MDSAKLNALRSFANGDIVDESVMNNEGDDFENDAEFMQECMEAALPMFLQHEIMDEAFEAMDEATQEAYLKVTDFMIQQGYMTEAAVPQINKKLNVVHLNKFAQLNRLTTIITLKLARRENGGKGSKNYVKYKMGQRIKKENMAAMRAKHGNKAERLAKKLWNQLQKSRKTTAVVTEVKEKTDKKVAAAKADKKK